MSHRIVWFDLPASDIKRAAQFYAAVLDIEVKEEFPGVAVLEHGDNDVSGCLFVSEDARPSASGPLLYFNVNGRLDQAVATAVEHGATIELAAHPIGPFGHRAILIDCEGNRIALHSE
ncbi:MAG: VOC family protein [Wenzhouxiangellaceae bacterium]